MNCASHPDAAAAAYCQQCGKPLCSECVRSVGPVVNCESCLQARLGVSPGAQPPFLPPAHPNPALAGLLGLIPGVGAMYNGQFIKALAHVLIFAVFVDLAKASIVFALLTVAWVFYQVFDAYQTALARRDGLPLPNPFGLNDLGPHFGFTGGFNGGFATGAPGGSAAGSTTGSPGGSAADPSAPPPDSTPPASPAPPPSSWTGSAAEAQAEARIPEAQLKDVAQPASPGQPTQSWRPNWAPNWPYAGPPPPYTPQAPFGPPPGQGAPPYATPPPGEAQGHAGAPTAAIVLIVVGVFLLLETLGIVRLFWIGRLWPVLFIVLGVWLAVCGRRQHRPGGEAP